MSEFMYGQEKYIEEDEQIIFENNTDSSFGVETGIIFHKSGLYDVNISNNHVVVSKVDERKAIEEAYQKGFEAGKAQNEDGCTGCMYDYVTAEHAPCKYCCNAYSNKWQAKPKTDEIKVGNEVKSRFTGDKAIVTSTEETGNDKHMYLMFDDGSAGEHDRSDFYKTGRHFPQVAELLKALKSGE